MAKKTIVVKQDWLANSPPRQDQRANVGWFGSEQNAQNPRIGRYTKRARHGSQGFSHGRDH
jgi:hypothetical protein